MRSIVHEPRRRSGEPIFLLFWTPISDVFLASTNAMETIVHEPRSGEPIFLLFWTPISDVFLASTNAMETIADFFCAILNPRKWCFPGIYYAMETIVPSSTSRVAASRFFLGLFWTPVSDVFLASTNAMETITVNDNVTCSLGSPRGGGGG